jgi:hypothetical protein
MKLTTQADFEAAERLLRPARHPGRLRLRCPCPWPGRRDRARRVRNFPIMPA